MRWSDVKLPCPPSGRIGNYLLVRGVELNFDQAIVMRYRRDWLIDTKQLVAGNRSRPNRQRPVAYRTGHEHWGALSLGFGQTQKKLALPLSTRHWLSRIAASAMMVLYR